MVVFMQEDRSRTNRQKEHIRMAGIGGIGGIVSKGLQIASQVTASIPGVPPGVSQGLAMGAQGASSLGGMNQQG
jgi:hypothetical protein